MASSDTTNERHTFTVKDVNVQEFLDDKENKSRFLRSLLRQEVYGDPQQPDGIDDQLWDTYNAVVSLFGVDAHYEMSAVVSGVAAEKNDPSEVVDRRIKRCVSLGLIERHTGIQKVTVAALPRGDIIIREDDR